MRKLAVLVFVVLLSHLVCAAPSLVVFVDEGLESIDDVAVVEYNGFGDVYTFEVDGAETAEALAVEIRDSSGSILGSSEVSGLRAELEYSKSVSSVVLLESGAVVAERAVDFCDDDGVCEPCNGSSCSLMENYLTCSDCSSGSNDGFCDTVSDGTCDPDCDFDAADPDCVSNCSQDCGVNISEALSCDDYDGSYCDVGDSCVGGYMVYAADWQLCCLGGLCADAGEYVETYVEMVSYPGYTISPSGVYAAEVEAQGIVAYCEDLMGGKACSAGELCSGSDVEYYLGSFCCLGSCLPVKNVTPVVVQESERSDYISVPESVIRAIFAVDVPSEEVVDTLDVPAPENYDLEEGEVPHESLAAEEMPVSSVAEQVSEVVEAAGEQLDRVNMAYIAAIALAVMFLVAVLVGIFRKSTEKSLVQPAVSLQGDIDSLVARGYDYRQVEQELVSKGNSRVFVDSEIRLNYQRRVDAQRGAR